MVNRSLPTLVALWEEDIRYAIQIEEDRDTSVQGREDNQEEGVIISQSFISRKKTPTSSETS